MHMMIQQQLGQLLPERTVNVPAALALLGGSVAALGVWKWLSKKMVQKKMEEARRTRDEGMKKMAKAVQQFREQVPGVQRDAILSLPLLELSGRLQEGSLSPRSVLYTYLEKALEVTQQTNCLRHFIPECEQQLQEIEQHEEKGLLYGIPVSIKDHIGHKGHLATCGLVQCLGTLMEEDSVLVKVLKRQGAIPFAMTNVPQSLFSYDCSNPIFGQTLNPLNPQKSPGGSSGGEGALIAGGGSILGVGSDIGGSIRLPSSFCGLCGLKPTASRLSLSGVTDPVNGILAGTFILNSFPLHPVKSLMFSCRPEENLRQPSLSGVCLKLPSLPAHSSMAVQGGGGCLAHPSAQCGCFCFFLSHAVSCAVGPMARDVDSLALCMKALLCQEMFQLDPTVPPIPFNEKVYSSSTPLRVGYYDTDGYVPLPPCMRRAVQETRHALQAAGHQLVLFSPPRIPYVMNELFFKTFFADGGRTWLDVFTGDIVDPGLKSQVNSCKIPRLVKKLLALLLKPLFPRLADYLSALAGMRSVKEMWNHHHQIQEYRSQFIAQWKELQLDVVLCPVLGPAFTTGYPGKLLNAISSTMLYNVLNFPAGVVPVSTVTEADEEELKLYKGCCDDPWDRTLKQAVSGALGLPVAVQCVALPWQEELCLRFMKEVETLSRDKRVP
ncbi:vitamin D3 hydroxylase-associated protein-like [Catharus ustulatus]|uniref:vitamin D3 hydroxylase-associated protein-like n=1 Tax=Catharus ustulatus TaxID=91951 RepID=UPI00140E2BE6|nr:vitamin D3 hydroxylase-associated protein-like [Catharus ustulatus]